MSKSDEEVAMVRRHVEALVEHFDSVHIFCTRHEAGEENATVHIDEHAGNFFARYGQVREWIIQQEEAARQSIQFRD